MSSDSQSAGASVRFQHLATAVTKWSGSFPASLLAFLSVIAWLIGGFLFFGFGDAYQLIINTGTTVITYLMVFLIQNTQNRESTALQLKLDELLSALPQARTEMVRLEDLTEQDLERLKQEFIGLKDNLG